MKNYLIRVADSGKTEIRSLQQPLTVQLASLLESVTITHDRVDLDEALDMISRDHSGDHKSD